MPTSFGLRFPSVYDGLDDRHLPPTVRSVKVPTASIWLERLLCAHTGAPLAPLVPIFFSTEEKTKRHEVVSSITCRRICCASRPSFGGFALRFPLRSRPIRIRCCWA